MNKPVLFYTFLLAIISFSSCHAQKEKDNHLIRAYVPKNIALYNTITEMDALFFEAYNNCDLEKQASIYSDDIEFFHDKGGLMTSKQELIEGTEKNICGKVTRELVKGSIEVYPIKDYGAVEIGYHKFYNNQEPDAVSHSSKFIILWKHVNHDWEISKVISLH